MRWRKTLPVFVDFPVVLSLFVEANTVRETQTAHCNRQHRRRPGRPRRVSLAVRVRQKAQALAAVLLWHDDLTDEQIAARCGVSRRTLARWKQHPFVQAAFYAYQAAWNAQQRREAAAARKREADALLRSLRERRDALMGRTPRRTAPPKP
jgi:AraC-like DNA-binding protein